ncbi:MAG: membrane protein insertase YidC [Pseudomonadota bacterium]
MELNKRTILWIVFSVALVALGDRWTTANGGRSMFSMAPAPVASAPKAVNANAGVPSATPSAAAALATPTGTPNAAPALAGERVTITTDVIKATINTAGGVIERLELLKHRDGVDPTKNQVLFDNNGHDVYLAQTGLIGAAGAPALPNHTTVFAAKPGTRSLEDGNQAQLVLVADQGGVKLTKTYTFTRGDYQIDVRHDVSNETGAPITPSLYLQLVHDGNKPPAPMFGSSYTGPTLFTEAAKYEKLEFEKIEKNKAEHATKADNGWIAISQHFFVSAFVPPQKAQREIFTKKVDTNLYAIGTILPMPAVAPGATVSMDSKLYSGPQESHILESVAPGLELVKDYGVLTVVAKPIFWLMEKIHGVMGNWGWTIIVLTILIKLAFFPLSAAGYRSMAKVKMVTPKMTAIRERYKNDPQKMNQATMELYKTEKINPLGGCLPLLVQMPVFFALYWVLQASVEMRGAPWVLWIHDLTVQDPYFVLPVLYMISMVVTQKLSPAPADPMQAKMMMFMPIIFSVMFAFFPSGLVLYWVVNNILSIAQQWVITKKFEAAK